MKLLDDLFEGFQKETPLTRFSILIPSIFEEKTLDERKETKIKDRAS